MSLSLLLLSVGFVVLVFIVAAYVVAVVVVFALVCEVWPRILAWSGGGSASSTDAVPYVGNALRHPCQTCTAKAAAVN
jgi:hypothetical protein